MTIDTLAVSRQLETAGIERGHAQAITDCINQSLTNERQALRAALVDEKQAQETARVGERQVSDSRFDAIDNRLNEMVTRGEFYKALWVLGAGVIAVNTALIGILFLALRTVLMGTGVSQ